MPERRVANRQVTDAAARGGDVGGAVAAGRARVARVGAEHVEHVPEVEADRADAQPDLPVRWLRLVALLRHQPQAAHRPSRVKVEPDRAAQRASRLGQARHALARAVKGHLGLGSAVVAEAELPAQLRHRSPLGRCPAGARPGR